VSDTVDHAVVRLVVNEPDKAMHVLGDAGMLVVETDVLVAEVPNVPGALAGIARRLADSEVNIEYAYCTASARHDSGTLIIRTREPVRAMKALQAD